MLIRNNFPLYGEYDVIVAGGGTAGFTAAVTAAKSGAKTLVIEEQAFLGGMATGGMISQFMGFSQGEKREDLKGVFAELLERLIAKNACPGVETIYLAGIKEMDVGAAPYDSETLKCVMDEMVKEAGAHVLFHTRVMGVEVENNEITSLLIHNSQGVQSVQAKVYIDATFHGSIASEAGCKWKIGDEKGVLQPGTLMYKMVNVDGGRYNTLTSADKARIAQKGIKEGALFVNTLLARPLPNNVFYSNMSRIYADPFDVPAWSRSEADARAQVQKISRFFIENVPGFEKAVMVSTGSYLGLRDSRRIIGQYTLTAQDVMDGTEFDDAIAKSCYPVDIHDANGYGSTLIKPKTGAFYVPFRCMITTIKNMVLAGRSISTDCEAHACVRVMVTCMRIGAAAGLAAAESIRQNIAVNELDGSILKKQLL